MIALPAGVLVWLAAGAKDLRKGFDGLAGLVQTQLAEDPFSGQLFVFRGRRGDRIKILWWDGDGLCLFAKCLERGRCARRVSYMAGSASPQRLRVLAFSRQSGRAAVGVMPLYILQRLLATVPVLAIVALLVFSLLYLAPGDPAVVLAGDQASAADVERLRAALALDQPFLTRFGAWIGDVLRGNLGTSVFSGRPVADLILQRLEPTVALTIAALLIAILIALPLGVLAAWRAGGLVDRVAMGFAVLGFSVPVFVLAYLLISLLSVQWGLLPVQGYRPIAQGIGPFLRHLALPALTLGIVNATLITRITRASMLEVLQQDFIRTARAKGLPVRSVLVTHALRNAALPIVTIIGISFAMLVSGVVVTETVFNIPGLGRLTVDAILRRDYPLIQGIILVFSATYLVVNLMVDLSYAWLDPRVRY